MFKVLHDLQLFQDVSHFVAFHTFQLVHVLHGVHLLGVFLLDYADLVKAGLGLLPCNALFFLQSQQKADNILFYDCCLKQNDRKPESRDRMPQR